MRESDQAPADLQTGPVVIGEWSFLPESHELVKQTDCVKLEPRASQLLLFLIQSGGKTMSREVLIASAWPGMVVGDEVLTSAINKLRKALGDDRHKPRYIETIPKQGYRLIADIRAVVDDPEQTGLAVERRVASSTETKKPWLLAGVVVLLVIVGFMLLSASRAPSPSSAVNSPQSSAEPTPMVVVLPFENLSNDPEQDYFTDGITDDIITDLTRFNGIRVLAGNTTSRLRGQAIDHQQLIDDFNISHVLEGSVRKAGDVLRISARLIAASSGETLWAERYDKTLKDIFSVQDDVSQNIVSALSVQLTDQDKLAFERPTTSNFEAYDLYLQGRRNLTERTSETDRLALEFYHSAIEKDPNFARAYGAIAVALIRFANSSYAENTARQKDKALFYAQKAVELGNRSQNTYWALGFTHLYRKEFDRAEQAVRQSLEIAPNYADGLALMALIKNHLEQPKEAIELINRAIQLNPGYTWDYPFNLGFAYYLLEDYEMAEQQLTLALDRNQNARLPRLILIATYMGMQQPEDAEWEMEQLLHQFPNYTSRSLLNADPIRDTRSMNRYIERLHQAGLPQ